jgi:nitrate/nitrite transporter NarK
LAMISTGLSTLYRVTPVFLSFLLTLGMSNGSVFRRMPRRCRREIGVMTGLVGSAVCVGGGARAGVRFIARPLSRRR